MFMNRLDYLHFHSTDSVSIKADVVKGDMVFMVTLHGDASLERDLNKLIDALLEFTGRDKICN